MYDSLPPYGLQHARPPGPSPSLGVCPSSCPSSDVIQPSHPLLPSSPLPSIFPSTRVFSNDQHLWRTGSKNRLLGVLCMPHAPNTIKGLDKTPKSRLQPNPWRPLPSIHIRNHLASTLESAVAPPPTPTPAAAGASIMPCLNFLSGL